MQTDAEDDERISKADFQRAKAEYEALASEEDDSREEVEDLSKQPDDYMGCNGTGFLIGYDLGRLRQMALVPILLFSPDYKWIEVPARSKRYTLSWTGSTPGCDILRYAEFEINNLHVVVKIKDDTQTWSIKHILVHFFWDGCGQDDDSWPSSIRLEGITSLSFEEALPHGRIDPTYLATQLILRDIAGE